MATVRSYNSAYIDALERKIIVSGYVDAWGHLQLINGNDEVIDGGNILGDIPSKVAATEQELADQAAAAIRVPRPPEDITVLENIGFYDQHGNPKSKVTLIWSPVYFDIENHEIVVSEYQPYLGIEPLPRVQTPRADFIINGNQSVDFTVQANNGYGVFGGLSESFNVVGSLPEENVLVPTDPTFVSSSGHLWAKWDGEYTTEPTDSAYLVRAEAYDEDTEEWIPQDSVLYGAGLFYINVGGVGDSIPVRFIAHDRLQRETGISTPQAGTRVGVDMVDLDSELNQFLSDMEEAIGEIGGGILTIEDRTPVLADGDGKPDNALWMVKIDDEFTSFWEWTGTEWVSVPLSESIIPLVAIGSGTYGELDGVRLAAKSATIEKLAIGTFDNLITDTRFVESNIQKHWTISTGDEAKFEYITLAVGKTIRATSVEADDPIAISSKNLVSAASGQSFYVSFDFMKQITLGDDDPIFRLNFLDEAGQVVESHTVELEDDVEDPPDPDEWLKFEKLISVPDDEEIVSAEWGFEIGGFTGFFYFMNPYWREAAGGKLIVDGDIHARHITADSAMLEKLFVDELGAGRVTTSFLGSDIDGHIRVVAADQISFIIDDVSDLQNQISGEDGLYDQLGEVQNQVDANISDIDAVAEIITGEGGIQEQIDSTTTIINDIELSQTAILKKVDITGDGILLSSEEMDPGSTDPTYRLNINPARVEILASGQTVGSGDTYWQIDKFQTKNVVATETLSFGAHQASRFAAGRTTIKKL